MTKCRLSSWSSKDLRSLAGNAFNAHSVTGALQNGGTELGREMERQKRERDRIQEDGETEYRKMKRLKSERDIERWKREIEERD